MPSTDCSRLTLEPAWWTDVEPMLSRAKAPPAANVSVAAATMAPVLRRRDCERALRASARRARERRLDSSHGRWLAGSSVGTARNPLVPAAYGVSCRARARNCATPHYRRRFAPGACPTAPVGPPFAAGLPGGDSARSRSYEARHHSERTGCHRGSLGPKDGEEVQRAGKIPASEREVAHGDRGREAVIEPARDAQRAVRVVPAGVLDRPLVRAQLARVEEPEHVHAREVPLAQRGVLLRAVLAHVPRVAGAVGALGR